MTQADQSLLRTLVRSIDKKTEWEALGNQGDSIRLMLRQSHGEAQIDITRAELDSATESVVGANQLRERLKQARRRIFLPASPYTPWMLPKVEPIGAPMRTGGGGFRPRR